MPGIPRRSAAEWITAIEKARTVRYCFTEGASDARVIRSQCPDEATAAVHTVSDVDIELLDQDVVHAFLGGNRARVNKFASVMAAADQYNGVCVMDRDFEKYRPALDRNRCAVVTDESSLPLCFLERAMIARVTLRAVGYNVGLEDWTCLADASESLFVFRYWKATALPQTGIPEVVSSLFLRDGVLVFDWDDFLRRYIALGGHRFDSARIFQEIDGLRQTFEQERFAQRIRAGDLFDLLLKAAKLRRHVANTYAKATFEGHLFAAMEAIQPECINMMRLVSWLRWDVATLDVVWP
jgi:hypothetical protein